MASEQPKISDIFTPNDTPTITYVGRNDLALEKRLADHCNLSKMVVSISGPSKSGKTVLIKKVMDEDLVIPVIGSGISKPEELWNRVLQWMGTPATSTVVSSSGSQIGGSAKGGGELGLPLVAKGKAEVAVSAQRSSGTSTSITFENDGLIRVIKEIADSDFVIFIDDFHYIKDEIREEVGRQIKVANDSGVKIIVASVPHRTDDVVRSNSELRGRVASLDLGYWDTSHLIMIARQGFAALNIDLSPAIEKKLASEAMGSPQLMQTVCYCLCQVLGIFEPRADQERIDVSDNQINLALNQTTQFTDFSKMLTMLHAGPRTRGQERKEHNLVDGTMGDVYRAVLLAIRSDPIALSFSYDEILMRVKRVCKDDSPAGSSITSCLEQMTNISENVQPGKPVLVWDGDRLDVTDPYFAFFLRSSDKISKLSS